MRLKNLPREMYAEHIDRFYRQTRSLYEDVTVAMHWDGTYRDRFYCTDVYGRTFFYSGAEEPHMVRAAGGIAKHMGSKNT